MKAKKARDHNEFKASGPHDFQWHPEGKSGGFYSRAQRDGAIRFGFMAILKEFGEVADDFLYPMNWPGQPDGKRFFACAAEWPNGDTLVDLPQGVKISPKRDQEIELVSNQFGNLLDIAAHGDPHERREAKDVLSSIEGSMGTPGESQFSEGFAAGFRSACLLLGQDVAYWKDVADSRKPRESAMPYRISVEIAMRIHPSITGAKQLLEAIGAQSAEEKNKGVVWRDWLGREVYWDEWEASVKSANRRGASRVI